MDTIDATIPLAMVKAIADRTSNLVCFECARDGKYVAIEKNGYNNSQTTRGTIRDKTRISADLHVYDNDLNNLHSHEISTIHNWCAMRGVSLSYVRKSEREW